MVQVRRAAAGALLQLGADPRAAIITPYWEDTGLTRASLAFLQLKSRIPRKETVPLAKLEQLNKKPPPKTIKSICSQNSYYQTAGGQDKMQSE